MGHSDSLNVTAGFRGDLIPEAWNLTCVGGKIESHLSETTIAER